MPRTDRHHRRQAFRWLGEQLRELVDELLEDLDALDPGDVASIVAPVLDDRLDWQTAPPEIRPILEALDGPVLAAAVRALIVTAQRLPRRPEAAPSPA